MFKSAAKWIQTNKTRTMQAKNHKTNNACKLKKAKKSQSATNLQTTRKWTLATRNPINLKVGRNLAHQTRTHQTETTIFYDMQMEFEEAPDMLEDNWKRGVEKKSPKIGLSERIFFSGHSLFWLASGATRDEPFMPESIGQLCLSLGWNLRRRAWLSAISFQSTMTNRVDWTEAIGFGHRN